MTANNQVSIDATRSAAPSVQRLRLRRTVIATLGSAVGGGLSVFLPFVITREFGDGRRTDAYFVAAGTAVFATTILALVLENIAIPFIVEAKRSGADALAVFVKRTSLQAAFASFLIMAISSTIFSVFLLPRFDFSAQQHSETIKILLVLLPLPSLVTISSTLAGLHFGLQRFALPTASQAIQEACAIAAAFAFGRSIGPIAVAIGVVVGEFIRVTVLALNARKCITGLRPARSDRNLAPSSQRSFWKVAAPQISSMFIVGANPLIDKSVAATLPVGSVTTVELAQKLFLVPMLFLMSGIGLVSGTAWSEFVQDKSFDRLKRDFWRTQRVVATASIVVVAVAVAFVWLLRSIPAAIFGVTDVTLMVRAFAIFAAGVPFAMCHNLGLRLLLAFKQTRRLPIYALAAVVANLGFDVVGARMFGVAGIAMASLCVNVMNSALYLIAAKRLFTSVEHEITSVQFVRSSTSKLGPIHAGRSPRRSRTGGPRPEWLMGSLLVTIFAVSVGVVIARSWVLGVLLAGLPVFLFLLFLAPRHWLPTIALVSWCLIPIQYAWRNPATFSPAMAVIAVWLVRHLLDSKCISFRRAGWIIPLYCWSCLAILWSHARATSIYWLLPFVLLVMVPSLLSSEDVLTRNVLAAVWIRIGSLLGAYAMLESFVLKSNPAYGWIYRHSAQALTQHWSVYRATTSLGHPLLNATFFSMAAALALARWFDQREKASLAHVMLAAGGVIATGSRGGAIGLAGGCAAVLLVTLRPGRDVRRAGKILLVSTAGLLLCLGAMQYLGRRSHSSEGRLSSQTRAHMTADAQRMASQTRWQGIGPGLADSAHRRLPGAGPSLGLENSWLQVYVSLGIVGLLLFSAGVIGMFVDAVRRGNAAAVGLLVAYCVGAASFNLLEADRPALILLGLALFLAAGSKSALVPKPARLVAVHNGVSE